MKKNGERGHSYEKLAYEPGWQRGRRDGRRSDEGSENGTEDSFSILFRAFSNTAYLCAKMKMTLSTISAHITPLTHIHSRHAGHKALPLLKPVLNMKTVTIAMAECISEWAMFIPRTSRHGTNCRWFLS